MTVTQCRHVIVGLVLFSTCVTSLVVFAATWTQREGLYHWYKLGTQNRYALSTNIEIPATWVKQGGAYIQCVSNGGSKKYLAQGYDCNGTPIVIAPCQSFVCSDSFGWTFDLTKNSVLVCPRVKVTKDQALIYEGLQAGEISCK